MEEFLELRVRAEHAGLVFPPHEGTLMTGGHTRRIVIRADDPRLPAIRDAQARLRAGQPRDLLVSGAFISRKYTASEWASAELFRPRIVPVFDPTGEECGTVYDTTGCCPVCEAGRARVGPLRLDVRRIPKNVDIAHTIADDEIVVSERLADAIRKDGLTGVELSAVEHVGTGRGRTPAPWFALRVTSEPLPFTSGSRFGQDPLEATNDYACPLGDTLGHMLLSEAYLKRPEGSLRDFHISLQYVGGRQGLYVPARLMFVSPAAQRLLHSFQPRKVIFEIANLRSA
jgi:hypothetical protein